jgi:hypothetical protein
MKKVHRKLKYNHLEHETPQLPLRGFIFGLKRHAAAFRMGSMALPPLFMGKTNARPKEKRHDTGKKR